MIELQLHAFFYENFRFLFSFNRPDAMFLSDTSINIFFRIGDRKAGRGGGAGEDVNGDNRK